MARLDHLTRMQASALARIAGVAAASGPEADHVDGALARALLEAMEAKDPHTRGHCERVAQRAARLAAELACSAELVERVRLAGELHDLGKLGIPDAILVKPGALTAREWNAMRRHPELGARMLEPLTSLADVALWVRHHHEWFDGCGHGYPDRLMREQIPLPSRILAVADALDAITARHPYRRERPLAEALDELRALSGRRYDPVVVEAAAQLASRGGRRTRPTLRAVGDGS